MIEVLVTDEFGSWLNELKDLRKDISKAHALAAHWRSDHGGDGEDGP